MITLNFVIRNWITNVDLFTDKIKKYETILDITDSSDTSNAEVIEKQSQIKDWLILLLHPLVLAIQSDDERTIEVGLTSSLVREYSFIVIHSYMKTNWN